MDVHLWTSASGCTLNHWRRDRRAFVPSTMSAGMGGPFSPRFWNLTFCIGFLAKKCCFLNFVWVKWNFTTFDAPLEKSLPTPMPPQRNCPPYAHAPPTQLRGIRSLILLLSRQARGYKVVLSSLQGDWPRIKPNPSTWKIVPLFQYDTRNKFFYSCFP